jgi:hypothetical protein
MRFKQIEDHLFVARKLVLNLFYVDVINLILQLSLYERLYEDCMNLFRTNVQKRKNEAYFV